MKKQFSQNFFWTCTALYILCVSNAVIAELNQQFHKGDILEYKINIEPAPSLFFLLASVHFEHVGIYTGDGYVIEFSYDKDIFKPEIIKTPLKQFKAHSKTGVSVRYPYENMQARSPDDTVACAESFYKKSQGWFGNYNLMTNNCQHFASLCKYGVKRSWQIEELTKYAEDAYGKNVTNAMKYGVEKTQSAAEHIGQFSHQLLPNNY